MFKIFNYCSEFNSSLSLSLSLSRIARYSRNLYAIGLMVCCFSGVGNVYGITRDLTGQAGFTQLAGEVLAALAMPTGTSSTDQATLQAMVATVVALGYSSDVAKTVVSLAAYDSNRSYSGSDITAALGMYTSVSTIGAAPTGTGSAGTFSSISANHIEGNKGTDFTSDKGTDWGCGAGSDCISKTDATLSTNSPNVVEYNKVTVGDKTYTVGDIWNGDDLLTIKTISKNEIVIEYEGSGFCSGGVRHRIYKLNP